MTRRKSAAVVVVANGEGGMRQLEDLRFESGEWPIEFVIASDAAEAWMAHLTAEIEERGWSSSGISQVHPTENSGTLSVNAASGQSPPTLDIVWERARGGELRVRARPSIDPVLPLQDAFALIDAVAARQAEVRSLRAHRRHLLTYEGLPWRGELWLDSDLRLGPPSRFPNALLGQQIVIVDAMCEGIGQQGVTMTFQKLVGELRIFLGFVLGLTVQPVRTSSAWVYELDADGKITDCVLRPIGYVELSASAGFPEVGSAGPAERREVVRPDLGPMGIWPDMLEEWVPDDVENLWAAFRGLEEQKRDRLMRAGNAYSIARSMWPDQRTAFATFLVVACEALKPPGPQYKKKGIFWVVEDLLGAAPAMRLKGMAPNPQGLRDRHLHLAELAAGELVPMWMYDLFADPSFDQMIDELSRISRMCLIEWLRRQTSAAR